MRHSRPVGFVRPCAITFIVEADATEALAKLLNCHPNFAIATVAQLAAWLHDKRRTPRFAPNEALTAALGMPTFPPDVLAEYLVDAGWARRCIVRDSSRVYYEMKGWEILFPEDKRREQMRVASQRYRDNPKSKRSNKGRVLPELPTLPPMTAKEAILVLESRGIPVGPYSDEDRLDD